MKVLWCFILVSSFLPPPRDCDVALPTGRQEVGGAPSQTRVWLNSWWIMNETAASPPSSPSSGKKPNTENRFAPNAGKTLWRSGKKKVLFYVSFSALFFFPSKTIKITYIRSVSCIKKNDVPLRDVSVCCCWGDESADSVRDSLTHSVTESLAHSFDKVLAKKNTFQREATNMSAVTTLGTELGRKEKNYDNLLVIKNFVISKNTQKS